MLSFSGNKCMRVASLDPTPWRVMGVLDASATTTSQSTFPAPCVDCARCARSLLPVCYRDVQYIHPAQPISDIHVPPPGDTASSCTAYAVESAIWRDWLAHHKQPTQLSIGVINV